MRSRICSLAVSLLLAGVNIGRAAELDHSDYYRRVLYSRPMIFDPIAAATGNEIQVVRQVFDQLVAYDKDFHWKPMLASNWEISAGGRIYTFTIRKDVRFSDGTPLTPEDVLYSLKRIIKDPTSRHFTDLLRIKGALEYREGRAADITGISISGEKLVIESKSPNPYLLYALAASTASVIKRGYSGAAGGFPVGSGPFVPRCLNEREVVLEANKNYFLGAPKLPGIVYFVYDRKEDAFRDFLDKKLEDIAPFNLPPGSDRSGLKRVFTNGIISFILVFNQAAPPLDNKYLRQALVSAVDFDAVLAGLGGSFPLLTRTRSHIPKGRVGYDPSFSGLLYDPVKAGKLVRQAGYKAFGDVPPVKFMYTGNVPYTAEVVEGLSAYYSKAGLRFEPEKLTGAEAVENVKKGDWQMFILGTDWLYADSYMLLSSFHSGSPIKSLARKERKLDELLERCETEMNTSVRQEYFRKINTLLVNDAHVVPLFAGDMFDGSFQQWVDGVQYPNTSFFNLAMYPVSLDQKLSRNRPVKEITCVK